MEHIVNRLRNMNRLVLIGVALAVVVTGAFVAFGTGRATPKAQAKPQIVTVTTGDLEGTVAVSGLLTPKRDASLAFGGQGIVKEVRVAQGDTVRKGDLLARLDDGIAKQNVEKATMALSLAEVKLNSAKHDYETKVGWAPNGNQVNAAEANLANAEAAVKAAQAEYDKVAWLPWVSSTQPSMQLEQATNNYNRAKADLDYLYSNRPDVIFATDNLQAAQLGLNTAQIDLQIAKDTLDRMSITAPFNGTITSVSIEVGEAAGGPAIEMATMDHLEVVIDVDEVDVGALKVGQPASVTFSAWPGSVVSGKVISIAPKASATANVVNFEVHIGLDRTDLDLRAGMTADALIQTFLLEDVTLLPRDAVQIDTETGEAYVNLVTPTGAKRTEVTVGQRNDSHIHITSGLSDGDVVLANPGTIAP
jgi:HlyD family secretion protein